MAERAWTQNSCTKVIFLAAPGSAGDPPVPLGDGLPLAHLSERPALQLQPRHRHNSALSSQGAQHVLGPWPEDARGEADREIEVPASCQDLAAHTSRPAAAQGPGKAQAGRGGGRGVPLAMKQQHRGQTADLRRAQRGRHESRRGGFEVVAPAGRRLHGAHLVQPPRALELEVLTNVVDARNAAEGVHG
eukprot:CAMPEP_0175775622 /NCGR_PEP_ID=MMETSP0097-20121207/74218_1 /TAXON_ID=311494 /ORGANISM="Alexandrium monilatum, Strain CCMP3105" /LENGTH=188 /DNA_ID=CAMNT_0017086129 /DNA_START=223 /DNA_END=786 /DNA_ORIENTATION=+